MNIRGDGRKRFAARTFASSSTDGIDQVLPIDDDWVQIDPDSLTNRSINEFKNLELEERLTPGDKFKVIQNGVTKYFYVDDLTDIGFIILMPNTTIHEDDLTTDPINYIAYSKIDSPNGFPFAFYVYPVLTAESGMTVSDYGVDARFMMIGNLFKMWGIFTDVLLAGTAKSYLQFDIPHQNSAYSLNTIKPIIQLTYEDNLPVTTYIDVNYGLQIKKTNGTNWELGANHYGGSASPQGIYFEVEYILKPSRDV